MSEHESYPTLRGVVHLDDDEQRRVRRRRRFGYTATTLALTALMGVAVLDGLDLVDAVGVDDTTATASADGWELEVRHPTVARPALAAPFEITVRHAGGFDGPIDLAVDRRYLGLWDLNGVLPAPAEETGDADRLFWTFDPPDGDVLHITYEARIEPAVQSGVSGRVAVLDPQGDEVVAVEFDTDVRP